MRTEGVGKFPTPLVVTFAEATTLDQSELGAKAANLARLASVGFPVPPGFVVTTSRGGALARDVCPDIGGRGRAGR